MKTPLRSALDRIDTVLAKGDETSMALWEVLTALRGPDSGSEYVKLTSTAFIRQAAFPKTAARIQATQACLCALFNPCADTVPTLRGLKGHFYCHVKWAFDRLGIKYENQ